MEHTVALVLRKSICRIMALCGLPLRQIAIMLPSCYHGHRRHASPTRHEVAFSNWYGVPLSDIRGTLKKITTGQRRGTEIKQLKSHVIFYCIVHSIISSFIPHGFRQE